MYTLSNILFLVMVGLLLFGGLLSLLTSRSSRLSIVLGFSAAAAASLTGVALGLNVLIRGQQVNLVLPWGLAFSTLSFAVGPLSGFFIIVIAVVSLAVSIFSFGYAAEYAGKHNVGLMGLLYNLFILAMICLTASGNSLLFLFFWELMALASYLLVVFEHGDSRVRQAGFIYIVMTHLGTLFIFLAFLLLYKESGSFSFASYEAVGPSLPLHLKTVIFLLVTVGFGAKAGIIPLHIWLPKAHPAAPGNISALMSGVMLKTAIYGFVKIVIDVLGGGPAWWGVLILVLGVVSALLGVMYALMEHDIKRLLAYHSVENIGIILLGLGASLIFLAYDNRALAMVGLAAALFHVFNHAVFKALLFLGAGSVHVATGTRDMEKMGGLLKRMPWTGLFFLIGSVSISALPPFNGFVSEYLTFQSLLQLASARLGPGLSVLGPVAAAGLALTGALAAACFVKAFGIQFLALPRSSNAERAGEVAFSMRLGMALLALICFAAGVLPASVTGLLDPVTKSLLGVSTASLGGYRWLQAAPSLGGAPKVAPLALMLIMTVVILALYLISRFFGKGMPVRRAETWNCGMELAPNMEYTATAFAKPIRIIFKRIFLPQREIETEYVLKPYFTAEIRYSGSIKPVFEDVIYRPATRWFVKLAAKIRLLQSGSIHLYLAYIFITLVALLIFAR